MDWREAREEFGAVLSRWVFLDHASVCPLPKRTVRAIERYLAEVASSGVLHEKKTDPKVEEARGLSARLLGASPEEVAFVQNTTAGILIVANGLRWREGDNVVVARCEFPANIHPWRFLAERKGVEVRFVEGRPTPDAVKEAVDERTRLVSLSFVQYADGYRLDVEAVAEICRRVGALFLLDAIQGLGALRLNVKGSGVHFLSADGHKWLLGPEGAAVFYVSKEALEELDLVWCGWMSVEAPEEFERHDQPLKPSAKRFEPGTRNNAGIVGLGESIKLLLEVGMEEVERRVLYLTDLLVEGLKEKGHRVISPRGEREKSGIVSFVPQRADPRKVYKSLKALGVLVSLRGGAIRVSPHFYNSEEDIEALLDALERLRVSPPGP